MRAAEHIRVSVIPIGYHAMRMRWCRAALWAFVRRWSAYLLTGAALFSAGAYGGAGAAFAAVQGACAWLVLPLFRAAAEPVWIVPATMLQAAIGAGLVWAMRPLLWPARWAAAERALPLAPRVTLVSDARLVPLGLLPWALPCAVGAHALLASDPSWLHPVRGRALAALLLALAGSVAIGVVMLQWLRRPTRAPRRRAVSAVRVASIASPVAADAAAGARSNSGLRSGSAATAQFPLIVDAGWRRALAWWPLWRGPARRSGRALLAGTAALCVPALALLRWPGAAGWWLAAHALGALVVVTRLNALARLELAPLHAACAPLPQPLPPLARAREVLALAPLLPSVIALLGGLSPLDVRPAVLLGYLAATLGSCVVEVRSAPADAAAKSSRWLFCVALTIALASEVIR